ncbi:MAG: hypothetical protein A3E00_13780 [Curvibacter sp. RIFCSPHIGHO2_12_FULL_63_18]|nr:MAG: hypothetical protein A3E00_13780 [Curvibacter sp. RIFCSPHIGHO2_12_FULL_63_18]
MHRRPFLNIAAYTYLFVMLALLFLPLVSRAQNPALSSTPPAGKMLVNVFQTTSGANVYTYAAGTANAAHVPGLDIKMWNDAVAVDTYSTLDVGSGVKAPIGARSIPTKPSVAKALTRFAGKVIAPLAYGVAIYDLAKELGFTLDNSSGTVVVSKTDTNACTTGPCYYWTFNGHSYPTQALACAAYAPWQMSRFANLEVVSGAPTNGSSGACYVYERNKVTGAVGLDGNYAVGVDRGDSRAPDTGALLPSNMSELEAAIAAKSGWPSTTQLPKALEDAIASGESLPLPAPAQITGPTVIPMAPTITEFPDGSKTTVTPEKRLSFGQSSPTVTVTDGQTTTTTSPTGVTSTVSSGSSPATLPQTMDVKLETCGLPGKPACKIDETGTPTTPTKDGQSELTDGKKQLDDTLTAIKDKSDKDTSWGITPTWLQSGASCHPVVLMTFPAFLGNKQITLDICPHLDTIYLLMNALWIVWTFSAVLSMVRSSTTAGAI